MDRQQCQGGRLAFGVRRRAAPEWPRLSLGPFDFCDLSDLLPIDAANFATPNAKRRHAKRRTVPNG